MAGGVQVEAGPSCSGERPLVLGPLLEAVEPAHLQADARFVAPAVRLVLEEVPEEPLLQPETVVGVVLGPVLDPVDLEPLFGRGRLGEGLEVAPAVETLAAPVRGGQERHLDLGPVG